MCLEDGFSLVIDSDKKKIRNRFSDFIKSLDNQMNWDVIVASRRSSSPDNLVGPPWISGPVVHDGGAHFQTLQQTRIFLPERRPPPVCRKNFSAENRLCSGIYLIIIVLKFRDDCDWSRRLAAAVYTYGKEGFNYGTGTTKL